MFSRTVTSGRDHAGQMRHLQRIDKYRVGRMSTDPPVNTGASPDSTATITATDAVGTRCSRRKGRVVIDRDVLPAPGAGQTNREARPANLRKADLHRQREAGRLRNRSESTTEGLNRAGRVESVATGWWLLHVQRNARMHLRFAGGFDTMALRRRRIVISPRRLGPLPGSAVLDISRLERP